jgi:hypothetical protein
MQHSKLAIVLYPRNLGWRCDSNILEQNGKYIYQVT